MILARFYDEDPLGGHFAPQDLREDLILDLTEQTIHAVGTNTVSIERKFSIEITAAPSRVREAVSVGGLVLPTASEAMAFNATPP